MLAKLKFFSVLCRDAVCVDLIRVCDYESPLLRKVVIEVGDDLNSNICLSSARRSDNLRIQAEMRVMKTESRKMHQMDTKNELQLRKKVEKPIDNEMTENLTLKQACVTFFLSML